MDSSSKSAGGVVTPTKEKAASNRLKLIERGKFTENVNPNVSSPGLKFCHSPSIGKSANSAKKSASRKPNANQVATPSPKKKIRERKFVIAKKKWRKEDVDSSAAAVACEKCRKANGKSKCLCMAYESLRASQEEFFKNRSEIDEEVDIDKVRECEDGPEKDGTKVNRIVQNPGIANEGQKDENDALPEINGENGELGLKRSRDRLLEEARQSVPEPGSGRVMHLVKAFEKLRMMPKSVDSEEKEAEEMEDDKKGMKWALPGLQQPSKAPETRVSYSSLCPSDFFLTSESLGLDSCRSFSLESSKGSFSTRASAGGRKSRRSSSESSGTLTRRHGKRKQQKPTSQKPFMLRTEQRGRYKEEEFTKKLQQMMEEQEKLRIPIAQGLPWTTDQPECLVKPPVKENTRPADLVLHSDSRALERAEFDDQVAKKMNLIEQYRMEREREQKLTEEEEIRRLRKELVPKAQPMPYFDRRPFIPRRSAKQPTMPKQPKFQLPQHKKVKCFESLDDFLYVLNLKISFSLVIRCPLPPPPNRLKYRLSQRRPSRLFIPHKHPTPTTARPTRNSTIVRLRLEAESLMDMTRVWRGFEADRISNLPCDLIDNILKFLPVVDAVRTSILSRAWRHKWVTIPYLCFDWTLKKKLTGNYDLESIIYQVLLLHKGPIFKFELEADSRTYLYIDNWLHFLSNHLIEELVLDFSTVSIFPRISYHLFTFDHLTRLELIEVEVKLPSTFKGFGRLVQLDLFLVNFVAGELSKFISKCPMLEDLYIYYECKRVDLEIDAPNLKSLRLTGNFSSVSFKTACPLLVKMYLDSDFGILRDPEIFQDFSTNEPLLYNGNVVKILGQLSSITELEFSGSVLHYLARGGVPQKLPNDLNHVWRLCFHEIHLNCIFEASSAVCLIRSSPNLEILVIDDLSTIYDEAQMQTASQFLKTQRECEFPLKCLEYVMIDGFSGWELEMEFVKLLQSAATALRILEIRQMHAEPTEAAFKMFKELVTFPPASPEADIIFSVHPNAT
ncbi:F-box/LRR-repeat protein 25 [Sesamum alatum]|uniref:F-box/LRR-repeat protein 25 n=1 Tax=Sesamum alatum TaxID=300844 RepID=A0AAE1YA49_9LAMI|nr:F-box/LRR-repeat protein 25 [Sesamum alatum]